MYNSVLDECEILNKCPEEEFCQRCIKNVEIEE